MTVEEFATKAKQLYNDCDGFAGEEGHIAADRLMEECLESLGYGEGIKILNSMSGYWYA